MHGQNGPGSVFSGGRSTYSGSGGGGKDTGGGSIMRQVQDSGRGGGMYSGQYQHMMGLRDELGMGP